MTVGISALILTKIEEIEALHERERGIYGEIEAIAELAGDRNWDKLAKEIVEQRRIARAAGEQAEADLGSFNYSFEDGEPALITEQLWRDVAPKLRELFAGNSKALQTVEHIDKLTTMQASAGSAREHPVAEGHAPTTSQQDKKGLG